MSLVAIPVSVPVKRRIPWVLAIFVALAVVGVGWIILALTRGSGSAGVAGQFYRIAPIDMDIVINKDGELQAVNNVEIVSQVEGQNTILDIAKEGAFVHKGDIVCKFDSSEIETKIESQQLDLQRAEADLTAAKESKEIQESSNVANFEAANVDLTLAKLDLQEYVDGTYPADEKQALTAVEMAKIEVKNKEDDLDQTRSLFGKGFVMAMDVKTAEIALLKAKNDFEQKGTALTVLKTYTHEKMVTDKRNDVAQAEKKLLRVQRENNSSLAQKVADLRAKEESLAVRTRQMEHLKEQLANCVIKAPQDGMVVYSSSGSSSWGRRDTPIQPGAQVRWQELLIRLPDTSSMKAVCRINESQVSKLRVDPNNPLRATVKIVGQPKPLTAWLSSISIMADSSNRFWNPDSKEYPVDIRLDETPQGLKPGMSAEEVKIYIDRLYHVLAVPVGAVYAAGKDNYVFIRDGRDAKPVKVQIGQVNETHAQVASGISQGQEVLILQAGQGRDLLEKAGIKVEVQASTTQPFDGKMPPNGQPPHGNDRGNGHSGDSAAPAPAERDPSKSKRPADPAAGATPPAAGATPAPSGPSASTDTEGSRTVGGASRGSGGSSGGSGRRSRGDSSPGMRPPR